MANRWLIPFSEEKRGREKRAHYLVGSGQLGERLCMRGHIVNLALAEKSTGRKYCGHCRAILGAK